MTQPKNESNMVSDLIWKPKPQGNHIPDTLGTQYIPYKLVFEDASFMNTQGHYTKIVASDVHLKGAAFMNAKMEAMNIISTHSIRLDSSALMNTQMKSLVLLGKNITLDSAFMMNSTVEDIYIQADKLILDDVAFFNLHNLKTLNMNVKKIQPTDNTHKLQYQPSGLKHIWLNDVAYPTLTDLVHGGR